MDRDSSQSSSGNGSRVDIGSVEEAFVSGVHSGVERIPVFHPSAFSLA